MDRGSSVNIVIIMMSRNAEVQTSLCTLEFNSRCGDVGNG